jgi:ketosteroid isomerase-like protein
MTSRVSAAFTVAIFVSSLSLAADPKPKGAAASIRAADQEWSRVFGARDLEKSVNTCSETGSVLAPNAPRATGRQAIRQLFTGFFGLPDLAISWETSDVRVARSGDMGYSTGAYQMSFKDPTGKAISDHGKYVTVWEKQHDGTWRVLLDAFNSDLPVAPASN